MNEVTRAQKARLGLFLIISGGVLAALIIVISGTKFFAKRDTYFVRYRDTSVSGLEVGAQVKYHGVRVGRVDEIYIDPDEIEFVVIELSLKSGTPLKMDVKAEINQLSLTGLKIIELTGGSSKADVLLPDSEIPAGISTLEAITGKAEAVSVKLEIVLTNLVEFTKKENQEKIFNIIDEVAVVVNDFHNIVSDNQESISTVASNLKSASEKVKQLTETPAFLDIIANFDTTASNLKGVDLAKLVFSTQETLDKANAAFKHIDLTVLKGRHDFLVSLEVLREAIDSFNEFTRLISEDPSLILRGTSGQEIDPKIRR